MGTWGFSAQSWSLWAKTGPQPDDWLSLPRHLMDSADIARLLWGDWVAPGVRRSLEDSLGIPGEGGTLLAWLAGIHDVGKAAEFFQGQLAGRPGMEVFADRVVNAGLPLKMMGQRYRHAVGSAAALLRWLPRAIPSMNVEGASSLAAIVGAHHGLPARRGEVRELNAFSFSSEWMAVQDDLLAGMTSYTDAASVLGRLDVSSLTRERQMLLTGLVIMADWIASNQELFPLNVPVDASSVERAHQAWAELDLADGWRTRPLPVSESQAYADRFMWPEGREPWPVQVDVLRAAREMQGPGLLCIEAPMGVGKTEAALLAADVLARSTGRHGVMMAAPTMATSDALLRRVTQWAENAGENAPASLFLAHSKASLNEDMQSLPRRGLGIRSVGEDNHEAREAVVAHQWLAGRKKGLLSNIAVGTVDQLLFMALQSKHVMLRHVGLASKVVVVDEVHAYDEYMNQYLARALFWLGTYGVPVVLLSATLPRRIKAQLVTAYASGLHRKAVEEHEVPDVGDEYPVITVADSRGVSAVVSALSGRRQRVAVKPMGDDDGALKKMLDAVAVDGGCLLLVCSTVARAQHAYRLAQEAVGADARLLHARFTAADRLKRERELLEELGPMSRRGHGRPERRVVVATQVVEQSLDLDFDAMVSDIAPVDLLLQRSGRVHRHSRPEEDRPEWARQPILHIRGMDSAGSDSTPPRFEETQVLVYDEAALLAAVGVLHLHRDGLTLKIPEDIPRLVREGYAASPPLPADWSAMWQGAQQQSEAQRDEQRARAQSFLMDRPESDDVFEQLWPVERQDVDSLRGEAEGAAQVRDADPMLEVLLTKECPGGYAPAAAASTDTVVADGQVPSWHAERHLALSAVRLPYKFSQPRLFNRALDQLEEQTDPSWQESPLLRGQLQLALDSDGRGTLAGITLRYDEDLGLLEEKE